MLFLPGLNQVWKYATSIIDQAVSSHSKYSFPSLNYHSSLCVRRIDYCLVASFSCSQNYLYSMVMLRLVSILALFPINYSYRCGGRIIKLLQRTRPLSAKQACLKNFFTELWSYYSIWRLGELVMKGQVVTGDEGQEYYTGIMIGTARSSRTSAWHRLSNTGNFAVGARSVLVIFVDHLGHLTLSVVIVETSPALAVLSIAALCLLNAAISRMITRGWEY